MLKEIKGQHLREFLTVYDVKDLPKQKQDHQVWVDMNQVRFSSGVDNYRASGKYAPVT